MTTERTVEVRVGGDREVGGGGRGWTTFEKNKGVSNPLPTM